MTSLVMMYVYYDKNGDIKAITPMLEDSYGSSYAMFPLAELEPILAGKANPSDFKIQKMERLDGVKHTLIKKATKIDFNRKVRTLDNFLTKVPDLDSPDARDALIITNYTSDKIISIRLSKFVKEMFQNGTDDQKELVEEFILRGNSTIYITKKDNPHYLLHSCSFSTSDLYDRTTLNFKYDGDFRNCSAYTKKVIAGYRYREKD